MSGSSRLCLACLALFVSASCETLVGPPRLRSGLVWRDAPLPPLSAEVAPRIWLRVRGAEQARRRSLRLQLRRMLLEEGWQLLEDRAAAAVWLDVELRFWDENPFRDEGRSIWQHVLLGDRSRDLAALAPAAQDRRGILSGMGSTEREHDVVLDLLLRRPRGEAARSSLVAWVKRAELDDAEAAQSLAELVREGLRRSFQRIQSSSP